MAETKYLQVKGINDLEKFMVKELPNKINRSVLLSTIRASAKPMKEAAKSIVVKQSGALAESINLKAIRNRGHNENFAAMALAPMSGNMNAWAMYMDHYGGGVGSTAAKIMSGAISPDRAKKGRIRHGHLVEFGFKHRNGKHVAARPFLQPAFDQEADTFVRVFRKNLKVRVEAAAKKQRQEAKIK